MEEHIRANKVLYNPLNEIPKTDNTENVEKILKKITVKELKTHIMKTKNKTPGDTSYSQHLKIGSRKLFEILTILYNASLDLGYFPNGWKISLISMILKPNKPGSAPTSYMPISLLPILGKLFE